jgi:hypothetical protein
VPLVDGEGEGELHGDGDLLPVAEAENDGDAVVHALTVVEREYDEHAEIDGVGVEDAHAEAAGDWVVETVELSEAVSHGLVDTDNVRDTDVHPVAVEDTDAQPELEVVREGVDEPEIVGDADAERLGDDVTVTERVKDGEGDDECVTLTVTDGVIEKLELEVRTTVALPHTLTVAVCVDENVGEGDVERLIVGETENDADPELGRTIVVDAFDDEVLLEKPEADIVPEVDLEIDAVGETVNERVTVLHGDADVEKVPLPVFDNETVAELLASDALITLLGDMVVVNVADKEGAAETERADEPHAEMLKETDGDPDEVAAVDTVIRDPEAVGELIIDPDAIDAVPEFVGEMVGEPLAESDPDGEYDAVTQLETLREKVPESEIELQPLIDGVNELVSDGEADADVVPLPLTELVADVQPDTLCVALLHTVVLGEKLLVSDPLGERLGVSVPLTETVAETVTVGVMLKVGNPVPLCVPDSVDVSHIEYEPDTVIE